MRWGTAFDANSVNLLYRAVIAHAPTPIRFVCICDETPGLDNGIETRPIPDIGLSKADIARPGVWRKISLYAPELADLGHVLFIDLDMMIVGSLETFLTPTKGMTFLDTGSGWHPTRACDVKEPGTGIFSYTPVAEQNILAAFQADPQAAMDNFPNEQAFAAAHASSVAFWPEKDVLSFKRHLCHRYGKGLFKQPTPPPQDAKVIAFHGNPRPADTWEKPIWGPFPHIHRGRVGWIQKYLRGYGY